MVNRESHPGFYTDGTDFFEVVTSKRGYKYAKQLHVRRETQTRRIWTKWEYAPNALNRFQSWWPIGMVEATKFGRAHGVCLVCTKPLNVKSLKEGISPLCRDRIGVLV